MNRRDPAFQKLHPLERFHLNYEVQADGCWAWTGSRKHPNGYGQMMAWGKNWNAHRLAYVLLVGPIPDGLHLDHLCRFKPCVNPAHLEPVTPAENVRRWAETITHCPQGHEYAVVGRHHSQCRECKRQIDRRRWGGIANTEKDRRRRLTDVQVAEIRSLYAAGGITHKELAVRFGVSNQHISKLISGQRRMSEAAA